MMESFHAKDFGARPLVADGRLSDVEQAQELTSTAEMPKPSLNGAPSISSISTSPAPTYKVYKRRFLGLAQLVLLNVVISWDWIAFAPVSQITAQYFDIPESTVNWLSTAFLLAFCPAAPFAYYVLNRYGPKFSILVAAGLVLAGNWIKYGGTQASIFSLLMGGQLLIGFAQPFVLNAPVMYSSVWFSADGRTTATALASLANPLGAALGQLISPFWAVNPSDIPNMILFIAIISSAACLPTLLIPAKPPTPPSAGMALDNRRSHSVGEDIRALIKSPEFYLIFIPFSIYVGLFNSFSSLLNQILQPYNFSSTDAGIAGALLIAVGLAFAAIISPLVDKYKFYLAFIKFAIPVIGICYLIFIWVPSTSSIPFTYVICGILGAGSFGLVPVVLEFLAEIHYPVGPELASTICWSGGQLLGGVFIVIMNELKADDKADPPNNMQIALLLEAGICLVVIPLPICLGLFGRNKYVRLRRLEAEKDRSGYGVVDDERHLPSS